MSFCSLIDSNKQVINSTNDLVAIMSGGNQLYSSLSQLARQSYLMFSELSPCRLCLMLIINCTTTKVTLVLHQETTIQGYQYCSSLQRAFGSLISEDYKNFILTVGCTAVAIYRKGDMGFKTFDSHARYL